MREPRAEQCLREPRAEQCLREPRAEQCLREPKRAEQCLREPQAEQCLREPWAEQCLREPKRAESPKVPSPGQAKRHPGFGMRTMGAPCKGKSLRLSYTFALTGRSYIAFTTQGAASLALGYGIAGLSARSGSRNANAACARAQPHTPTHPTTKHDDKQ
jgi:hypothetical protein